MEIRKTLTTESKVLDVGCGNGTFLNDLKTQTRCQIFGVDISDLAVKAAKDSYDLEIIKGSTEDLTFSEGSFDLVTAWWSLAHVYNPVEELQRFSRLLKDNGYCICGMPNFNSFNARLFKTKWFHLDPPRHLYIFSPAVITKILEDNGFSVRKIIHSRNPSGLMCSMQYVLRGNFVSSHKLHPLLVKLLFLVSIFMAKLNYSDLIIVCAQKNSRPPSSQ